jgi:hypothetical protein
VLVLNLCNLSIKIWLNWFLTHTNLLILLVKFKGVSKLTAILLEASLLEAIHLFGLVYTNRIVINTIRIFIICVITIASISFLI